MKAVDAVRRISEELRKHSFFGSYDLWKYEPHYDIKLCEKCFNHALTKYRIGNHLRATFKYLVIIDANTIEVREHPNCRCLLRRVTSAEEYFLEIGAFLKEK